MKILFVTEYFPPETNAAATRVFERARLWRKAGAEVSVITGVPNFPQGKVHAGYENRWRQREQREEIAVVRVWTFVFPNRGRLRRILDQSSFFLTALLEALRQPRPDVIMATSPTLFAALAACLAARFRKLPFVLEIGDLGAASIGAVGAVRSRSLLGLLRRLEKYLYRRATRIIVQTEGMRREIAASGIRDDRIAVISNGVDADAFRNVPSLRAQREPGDEFVVGYVGTLGMSHGLEHVIEAAEILGPQSNVMFRLVGDGAARRDLERAARERGLENIVFDGPFPRERMPEAWAAVDLALVSLRNHPTFRTVVPSKILEAMACGIPVLLVAPEGEASALVERHGIGTVIPAEDSAALARIVAKLAESPELLEAQAANALSSVSAFDRKRQAARCLSVLEDAALDGLR